VRAAEDELASDAGASQADLSGSLKSLTAQHVAGDPGPVGGQGRTALAVQASAAEVELAAYAGVI